MGFFIIKLVLPNYKENQLTKLSLILTIPTTLKEYCKPSLSFGDDKLYRKVQDV